jgi:hypothetical protein
VPTLLRFTGAVKRDPAIAAWLAAQPGDLRSLAKPWFGDIPFAYVGVFTAHVNVGFFNGAGLPDRAGQLEGAGKRMRHVKLKPGVAFDHTALEALIAAAYADVAAPPKSEQPRQPEGTDKRLSVVRRSG